MGKFYTREILSDIEYITEDEKAENAIYYDQVRSLILNYLDIQYRLSTYDQNRYFLGHGYFSGDNVSMKMKYVGIERAFWCSFIPYFWFCR